jgi:hypothetical protein
MQPCIGMGNLKACVHACVLQCGYPWPRSSLFRKGVLCCDPWGPLGEHTSRSAPGPISWAAVGAYSGCMGVLGCQVPLEKQLRHAWAIFHGLRGGGGFLGLV